MKILTETNEMEKRIYLFLGFFIMAIIASLFCFKEPNIFGYALICIAFMIFNGVMLIYRAIQLATLRILSKQEECNGIN